MSIELSHTHLSMDERRTGRLGEEPARPVPGVPTAGCSNPFSFRVQDEAEPRRPTRMPGAWRGSSGFSQRPAWLPVGNPWDRQRTYNIQIRRWTPDWEDSRRS